MANFAQLQDIKNRIVRDLANQQSQLTTAKGSFAAVSQSLATLQATYTGWAGEVNLLYAADPSDPAIAALKAERDLLIAEFAGTKAEADNLHDAVQSVDESSSSG